MPSGLRYRDLRIGGGSFPQKGDLVVARFTISAEPTGELLDDSTASGKAILLTFGRRPLPSGLCPGAEEALAGMRAGGKRVAVIPPALAFPEPTELFNGRAVDARQQLKYVIEIVKVSVSPS